MGSYRRRHYRRRRNGSDGLIGLGIIFALIAYSYGAELNRALTIAVIVGLAVLVIIIVVKLVRWWRGRQYKFQVDPNLDLNSLTGIEFEQYVAARLKERGYTKIKLTEYYDLGVDIIAYKDGKTWGVQVKRCSGLVKAAAVRQVVTALKRYKCDRAMVITNGRYSRPAVELAKSNDCLLVQL
ncbi:MAG TPA: restriction endonuclease [Candidatus Saccharimonadales bacterium]|nr:restriction endonuclease [Candidatus Saccharimonadales bacterium]